MRCAFRSCIPLNTFDGEVAAARQLKPRTVQLSLYKGKATAVWSDENKLSSYKRLSLKLWFPACVLILIIECKIKYSDKKFKFSLCLIERRDKKTYQGVKYSATHF